MIPARPSEHQKSHISHDTSGGKKKAHLRGDVLMVHIKSDVAAAGLVNQDHRPSCLTSTWCADSLSNASLLTLTSVCVCVGLNY